MKVLIGTILAMTLMGCSDKTSSGDPRTRPGDMEVLSSQDIQQLVSTFNSSSLIDPELRLAEGLLTVFHNRSVKPANINALGRFLNTKVTLECSNECYLINKDEK